MSNKSFNPIIEVADDDLIIDDIGEWAIEKYKLIGFYCDMFTKSMKRKWTHLVYIDLFSSAGYGRIRNTKRIIRTSPLISLSLPNPFTEYIFCEMDEQKCDSLYKRLDRDFKEKNCVIINGDSNKQIELIKKHIPQYSKSNTVLSFCFVDPYAMQNLHFDTIKQLGSLAMDFLVLIPTGMDLNRNYRYYYELKNNNVANFLSFPGWRTEFDKLNVRGNSEFLRFIVDNFTNKMLEMGYKNPKTF